MHDSTLTPTSAPSPRTASRLRGVGVGFVRGVAWLVLSAAIFVGCLYLYTRYNTFPSSYQPDESGKVRQVLSPEGERNFNHPQLMLEGALLVMHQTEWPADGIHTVVAGRWASALLAALGATMMSWLGYRLRGFGGMLLLGAGIGLCPSMLQAAHYMKEDASLLGGLCVMISMSGLYAYADRAGWQKTFWALLFGAGVALASSGKYVGMISLVPALLVLFFCCRREWVIASTVAFCVGCVGTYALVNYRAVENQEGFWQGFEREKNHSETEHSELTMTKPNGFFVDATVEETMPHALALAGLALMMFLPSYRSRRLWDVIVPIGFPLLFLAALSTSVIPFNRYALPVVMMVYLLAALGVLWLADALRLWRPRAGAWVVWSGVVLLLLLQLPRCLDDLDQFAFDSRDAARNWLAWNVPAGAQILADDYAKVDETEPWLDRRPSRTPRAAVQAPFFAADAGPLENLRRRGVSYVVVCSTAYDRFFIPQVMPSEGSFEQVIFRQRWYQRLFRTGKLVREFTPRTPLRALPVNPTIRIYRIDDAS